MKRLVLFFCSILIVLTGTGGGVSHATMVFSDDFDDPSFTAENWGNERGDWAASDGVYNAASPSNNPGTYSSVLGFDTLTDFTVDVDIKNLDDGGIWLRSNWDGGYVDGVILVTGGGGGGNDGLYWHVVYNNSWGTSLESVTIPGIQGDDVHLTIKVVGNTYSVYVNGSDTAATTLTTSAFSSGSVGLYEFRNVQSFDNFGLYDDSAPVPEPGTLLLLGCGLVGLAGAGRRYRR